MKKPLLYGLLTVATVVLAEVLARIFLWSPAYDVDFGTPRQGLTADAVGDWVPDQRAVWVNKLERPYFVRINKAGFRNADDLNPDALRILALGDSFTFGLNVSVYDVWTRVAEKRLSARLETPVQILNNGLPGATIVDYIAYLREKGAQLSPQIVLLVTYSNDVEDLQKAETTMGTVRAFGIGSTDSVKMHRLRWFLGHHSALYVAARKIKEGLLIRRHGEERRTAAIPANNPPPSRAKKVRGDTRDTGDTKDTGEFDRYGKLVGEAIDEVRKLDAKPVLVYLPNPNHSGDRLFRILEGLAGSHSVALIDLRPSFAGFERETLSLGADTSIDPDYPGDAHLSRFGNYQVGKQFARQFEGVLRKYLDSSAGTRNPLPAR